VNRTAAILLVFSIVPFLGCLDKETDIVKVDDELENTIRSCILTPYNVCGYNASLVAFEDGSLLKCRIQNTVTFSNFSCAGWDNVTNTHNVKFNATLVVKYRADGIRNSTLNSKIQYHLPDGYHDTTIILKVTKEYDVKEYRIFTNATEKSLLDPIQVRAWSKASLIRMIIRGENYFDYVWIRIDVT